MHRRYKPKIPLYFTWSPNLAYVVGLITTDGCLSSNRRSVIFTSQDIELIGHVKLILNAKGKIGLTKNQKCETYRIQIGNVQLYDWLLSIGLMPNKSLVLGKIVVPDEYFIDFLRGHLDGDGSITTYTDRFNTTKNLKYIYQRLWTRFISASEKHVIWLQETITRLIGLHGKIHKTKINHLGNRMYILKFAKKESLKLLAKIYYSEKIPHLARKKKIYTIFSQKYEKKN
ncbi:MAG: hypothetical protein KGJ35_01565 [Patescibacteria group bacterium]|nr:hypothetical protein [Patescibacteria group bacterium]